MPEWSHHPREAPAHKVYNTERVFLDCDAERQFIHHLGRQAFSIDLPLPNEPFVCMLVLSLLYISSGNAILSPSSARGSGGKNLRVCCWIHPGRWRQAAGLEAPCRAVLSQGVFILCHLTLFVSLFFCLAMIQPSWSPSSQDGTWFLLPAPKFTCYT